MKERIMMYRIRYDGELSHSKSKYEGGFYKVGSKAMNTAAYNHDYYIKNKEKWAKNKESSIGKAATKEPERKDHTIKFQNGMEIPDWIVRLSTLYVIDIVDYLEAHKIQPNRRWRGPEQNYTEEMKKYNEAKAKKIVEKHEKTSFFDTNGFFNVGGFFSKNKKKERKKASKPIKHSAVAQTSSGGRGSKSKYVGGFELKGNRMNNTKAYNHDYYIKNKEKWAKSKQRKDAALGSLFFIPTSLFNSILNFSVSTIATGLNFINNLLTTPNNKTTETDLKPEVVDNKSISIKNVKNNEHKYLYKVTRADGSVRYFYSNAEYNAYLSNFNIKNPETTLMNDIQAVNPGYRTNRRNNDENCAYCTLAYDLRKRGYDVTAISEDDKNFTSVYMNTIQSWYEGGDKAVNHHRAEIKNNSVDVNVETKKLFSELSEQGDGASGFIMVSWRTGGGHAMAYQVVDGQAYIIDAQSSKIYREESFNSDIAPHCIWGYNNDKTGYMDNFLVSYMRTDNLKPSSKVSKIVKNASDSEKKNSFDDYVGPGDKIELVEDDDISKHMRV